MKKPKNYYCHRKEHDLSSNRDFAYNNLQVIDKIGEGSFGSVYKVFDPNTSKLMVVKKNKQSTQLGLTQQDEVLKELSTSNGFSTLRVQSYTSPNQIYMQCLGPSLGKVMRKVKKINSYSLKRIARQILERLKEMHSHQYVHRDLKPDNILLGNSNDPHTIYLIDFGLTSNFKKKTTKQRKVYNGLIGTAKFCPISSHFGLQQLPKDDLESAGYVFSYLVSGSLPWSQIKYGNDEQLFEEIRKRKQTSSCEELSGGLNCLRIYFEEIRKLSAGEKINYSILIDLFEVENDLPECCFDFCDTVRGKCLNISGLQNKDKGIQVEGKPNRIRCSILNQ